jgi:error-prone DNA polymerase
LPPTSLGEAVVADYAMLQLSLRAHPMEILRGDLPATRPRLRPAAELAQAGDGTRVCVAGLVLVRQQPGSAKGIVFMTIEDETGVANLIVRPPLFERFRPVVLGGRLVIARGRLQCQGEAPLQVLHVVVETLDDASDLLARLNGMTTASQPPLAPPLARADEAGKGPTRETRRGTSATAAAPSLFPSRDFH